MSWARFQKIPSALRRTVLRNLITTKLFLARCEATRRGVDVRMVIQSWKFAEP